MAGTTVPLPPAEAAPAMNIARRFGGIDRLHGSGALARHTEGHVCVVGIGGVGSWAAEALARSGVGKLTLIDLDHVAESNINRQAQATDNTLGQAKVSAMASRIHAINPACKVREIDEFVTEENLVSLLTPDCDVVIDAIDQVRAKVAMIAHCKQQAIPIVVAGGAGGKSEPSAIRIDDLARTVQDPLLSRVRAQLRKNHGFTRKAGSRFGIPVVFSSEPLQSPVAGDVCHTVGEAGSGLNCAGYGSSVCITASFGFFAASLAMQLLRERER